MCFRMNSISFTLKIFVIDKNKKIFIRISPFARVSAVQASIILHLFIVTIFFCFLPEKKNNIFSHRNSFNFDFFVVFVVDVSMGIIISNIKNENENGFSMSIQMLVIFGNAAPNKIFFPRKKRRKKKKRRHIMTFYRHFRYIWFMGLIVLLTSVSTAAPSTKQNKKNMKEKKAFIRKRKRFIFFNFSIQWFLSSIKSNKWNSIC